MQASEFLDSIHVIYSLYSRAAGRDDVDNEGNGYCGMDMELAHRFWRKMDIQLYRDENSINGYLDKRIFKRGISKWIFKRGISKWIFKHGKNQTDT